MRLGVQLAVPKSDIVLPVGISFFTFQALGYLIDLYRREIQAEPNFWRFTLFVSFFPQLVAGPIERSKNLLAQLACTPPFSYHRIRAGLLTMLYGFFLKLVIADRCAVLVNQVYGHYQNYSGIILIVATILFALQIYCDFMGYSTIAQGAAQVLGYSLMDNFAQPYFSCTTKEFWRRWHISLSSWFRDYLYIPLGGSRRGLVRKYLNVMITFSLSGLWHGANLTFVIWGALNGLYQLLGDGVSAMLRAIGRFLPISLPDWTSFSWRLVRAVKTFCLVSISWVFFRADSVAAALAILKSATHCSNIGLLLTGELYKLGLDIFNFNILTIALLLLLVVSSLKERGQDLVQLLSQQNAVVRYLVYWGAIILIVFSLDITGQEFIYFQF